MNVKVLTSLLLSYAFFPEVSASLRNEVLVVGQDHFWYLTMIHTGIGLFLGFILKSFLISFSSAGSLISQQMGFGAIRYFDPMSESQVGPFEKLIQWTLLVLIISSGALLPMFKGIYLSFFSINTLSMTRFSQSPDMILELFKNLFSISILLASPIMFLNLMINAVMGIISRTIPQMNIISVSFAINIGVGLVVFAISSDEFFHVAFKLYVEKLGTWFQFVS
jgi:flagellar biosynthetic protein FliR